MADETKKINIVELDIEQDQALSDLTELQTSIQGTKEEIAALNKVQKQLAADQKTESAAYQKNAKQIEVSKIQLKSLNKEYGTQQKVVNDILQTEQRELGTLEKLTLRNKELRQELRELNLETEEGTKRQKEIVGEIDSNTDTIKENSDSLVQAKMNVGNYTQGIEDSIPALKGMMMGLKSVKTAAKAFLATPIGLILAVAAVGIGLLIKGFQKSQVFADKMKVTNKALGASFDVIIDRVSNGMEKAFKRLREDPLQAVKDLANGIKDNLVNRVKAMPLIFVKAFEAVKNAIKGNADEAKKSMVELSQAFVQFNTGVDAAQQKKIADGIKSVTDEIKAEAAEAKRLAQAQIDLEDLEVKLISTTADLTKKREEAKLATRDETLSVEEKLAAQDRAIALDKQLLDVELGVAKERARISQEQIDMGKSTRADLRENAELQAEVTRLESGYFTRAKELASERLSLSNMLKAEEVARVETVKQKLLEEAQALELFVNNEVEIWKLRNQTAVDSAKTLTDDLIAGEEERLNELEGMRLAAVEQSFQNELLTEQERQIQILQIQQETNDAKLKLEEDFQAQKIELQEKQAAQQFELQRMSLEQQLGTEFEIRRQTLEKWHDDQTKMAKGNEETLSQLELTYSQLRTEINRAERDARMEGMRGIFASVQGLMEENTVAYKAASTAVIAIDTYKSAMAAYASMAAIPVVGPALGIAAAALATGMGLKSIQKVWAVNAKSGASSVSSPSGTSSVTSSAIPEAQVSSSGGLVERSLNVSGGQSETEYVPVLNVDQVTADQYNLETIQDLASV